MLASAPIAARRGLSGCLAEVNNAGNKGEAAGSEAPFTQRSALFGQPQALAHSVPVLRSSPAHPSLPSSSMSSIHEPPHPDYLPPPKRARVDNPPLPPPPAFIPGPPGPSTAPIPDQDGAADAAAKKNRKRPLSCGECRRYVSYTFYASNGLSAPHLLPG